MFISVAARKARMAISPRLATRSFEIIELVSSSPSDHNGPTAWGSDSANVHHLMRSYEDTDLRFAHRGTSPDCEIRAPLQRASYNRVDQ